MIYICPFSFRNCDVKPFYTVCNDKLSPPFNGIRLIRLAYKMMAISRVLSHIQWRPSSLSIKSHTKRIDKFMQNIIGGRLFEGAKADATSQMRQKSDISYRESCDCRLAHWTSACTTEYQRQQLIQLVWPRTIAQHPETSPRCVLPLHLSLSLSLLFTHKHTHICMNCTIVRQATTSTTTH